ncbi:polyprotein [Rhynchospora pubera]|uniref:Polyprotein n=1 Tax=Rhynchospora pubera TaxID=906938 RepID=A0AAV8EGF3_9POAL|nr:polyprotein [Rhynchospora pubera]
MEIWSELQKLLSSNSRSRVMDLKRQIQSATKGNLSCADYLQGLRRLADELASVGSPYPDDELVMAAINGLGSDYLPVVAAVNAASVHSSFSFSDLHTLLLGHEALLKTHTMSPAVFYAGRNSHGRPRAPYPNPTAPTTRPDTVPRFPFSQNATQFVNGPDQQTRPASVKLVCQICTRVGHAAKICYKRYDPDPEWKPNPRFQAFTAQAQFAPPSATDWIIDSGANQHVTCDINNLTSFLTYDGGDKLQIGNGPPRQDSTSKVHSSNGLFIVNLKHHIQAFLSNRVSSSIWHARLGHPSNAITLEVLNSNNLSCNKNRLSLCHNCAQAKAHILPFSPSSSVSSFPLQIVHSDVWGPSPIVSSNGYRYYITFVDDFSRFTWIYFMKQKSEVSHIFSLFKAQVENLLNTTIKILRSDGGTEYKPITKFFPQIIHQTTCPYTPQQNGSAERKHRHIIELSLATMSYASIPSTYWDEIFSSIVFLINRLPSNKSIPFTTLFKKDPDYSLLRILGCLCFPLTRPYNSHKLELRSLPCVFLGYSSSQKGYRCLHLDTKKIYVSRNVVFDESNFPFKKMAQKTNSDANVDVSDQICTMPLQISQPTQAQQLFGPTQLQNPVDANPTQSVLPNILPHVSTSAATRAEPPQTPQATLVPSTPPPPQLIPATTQPTQQTIVSSSQPAPLTPSTSTNSVHPMTTRTRDHTRKPRHFNDFVAHLASLETEPRSFNQANTLPAWREAMAVEIQALALNKTWTLVPPPADQKVIASKWIYKIKRKPDGSIERFKARLVANGFHQEEGVDFQETYSPVVRATTIRVVLSIAVSSNWSIKQLDVQNAFLHGDLTETVYMAQPRGFVDSTFPDHVCLLHKSLYGLKQAPRAWFHKLNSALIGFGFKPSSYDPSLFIYAQHNHKLMVLVYVDDILVTGDDSNQVSACIEQLKAQFAVKDLGTIHYFFGAGSSLLLKWFAFNTIQIHC